jgi:hypothetical protein
MHKVYFAFLLFLVGYFLMSCDNFSQPTQYYRKVLLDGSVKKNAKQYQNPKFYYSADYRNKYSQDQYYWYSTPCIGGILWIPDSFIPHSRILNKAIESYKLNNKNQTNIIGFVDVAVFENGQIVLGITNRCQQFRGIPVTQKQLEELEKQGAIYD